MSEMDKVLADAYERRAKLESDRSAHRARGEQIDTATFVVLLWCCVAPVVVFGIWAAIVGVGSQ